MNAAAQTAPDETEPLPWAEIRARYPDQYVCLVDIVGVEPGNPEISTARVVGYGSTSDAAFEPIRELPKPFPLRVAVLTVLNVTTHDFALMVFPLGHDIDGLVGMNFLRHFNFEVHQEERLIRLEMSNH